jgi:hypothetical protein
MTQDQYGQARDPGYVVRGDADPNDETEGYPTEEAKPKTRFQKVASVILGDKQDQDEADQGQPAGQRVTAGHDAAASPDSMAQNPDAPAASPPWVTEQDEAAMADSPISQEAPGAAGPASADSPVVPAARAGDGSGTAASGIRSRDYWDEPEAEADGTEAAAVTRPDGPASNAAAVQDPVAGQAGRDTMGHPATEPDTFGTTRPDNGTRTAPYAEGQPGAAGAADAATIADVPATSTPTGDVPVGDVPAGDVPVVGAARRHAAPEADAAAPAAGQAAPAGGEMRPGEATGALGDFSDLTYGNLVPDVEQYAAQWQQVQFRFVDDPNGSVTEAADIVAQVTAKMEAAIQERQRAIEERQRAIAEQQRSLRGRWGEGTNADTEALRETLRMYKTFLDQLIGPRAS